MGLPTNYANYKKYVFIVHDEMSTGLTPDAAGAENYKVYVKRDADEYDVTDQFTSKVEGQKITINPTSNNLKTVKFKIAEEDNYINKDDKIIVRYHAKLNTNAVVGNTGNYNKAHLEYSNDPYDTGDGKTGKTPEDKVTVFTFTLHFKKLDNKENDLGGAGFTLYKLVEKKDDPGKYDEVPVHADVQGANATADPNKKEFTFKGLDAGKYVLKETTVPKGYSKARDLYFEIVATEEYKDETGAKVTKLEFKDGKGEGDNTNNTNVKDFEKEAADPFGTINGKIVNTTRNELPSTGGIGTTLFYLIGGIAVVTAGVLYVTKRKVNSQDVE